MSAPEAIDCHAHVLAKGRKITSDRHVPPGRDYTIDELLQIFKEHGISRGLLTAPSYYLTDNSLLLSALARAPFLRGTVLTTAEASAALPQAAGLKEMGVPGEETPLWWILLAPKGTPHALVEKLVDTMEKGAGSAAMRQFLTETGNPFVLFKGDELKARLGRKYEGLKAVAKSLNMSP